MNSRTRWHGGILVLAFGIAGFAGGWPNTAAAQVVTSKQCSRCQAFLPLWQSVGSSCPNCGVHFSGEQYQYTGGSSPGSRLTPEQMLLELMLQRQLLEHQERQKIREERTARMTEVRAEIASARTQAYDRLREKAEEVRRQDDPERRAQQYLAAGRRSESDGSLKAAIAYYGLAVRAVPDSAAGRLAAAKLQRLRPE